MRYFDDIQYRYNADKNKKLILTRKISFEEIIAAILDDKVLAITDHYNKEKYPNQKIAYVEILAKIYIVPYIEENENSIFLKTAFPCSKAYKTLKLKEPKC